MLRGLMPTPIPYRDAVKAGWTSPTNVRSSRPTRDRPAVKITPPEDEPPPAATRRSSPLPNRVFGVGLNFNLLTRFTSMMPDRPGAMPVIVKPGAFDASLRLAKKRVGCVRLLVGHDENRELLNTYDPSFEVWAGDESLYWRVRPETSAGRKAMEFIVNSPELRQCSVGFSGFDPAEVFNGSFWRARQMDLEEISIVTEGANTGTRVILGY